MSKYKDNEGVTPLTQNARNNPNLMPVPVTPLHLQVHHSSTVIKEDDEDNKARTMSVGVIIVYQNGNLV
jgi:hypothetical protein